MIRVPAGVVAVVLLLTGCSGPVDVAGAEDRVPVAVATEPASPNPAPGATLRQVVGDQRMRLDLPTTDTVRGVALYFHGQFSSVDDWMDDPYLDILGADGWAVASADLHLDNWGSPASVDDAVTLADWATAETGATLTLLVAGSMGGLTSLNALIDGALEARCWFGTMPVVDLNAVSRVPHADTQVHEVYGGTPPASSNPASRLDHLPTTVRYFVVHSPEDTWVPSAAHADRLIAALRQSGAELSVLPAIGEHGHESQVRPLDLRNFAATCL
jgi:hypothetical protein